MVFFCLEIFSSSFLVTFSLTLFRLCCCQMCSSSYQWIPLHEKKRKRNPLGILFQTPWLWNHVSFVYHLNKKKAVKSPLVSLEDREGVEEDAILREMNLTVKGLWPLFLFFSFASLCLVSCLFLDKYQGSSRDWCVSSLLLDFHLFSFRLLLGCLLLLPSSSFFSLEPSFDFYCHGSLHTIQVNEQYSVDIQEFPAVFPLSF